MSSKSQTHTASPPAASRRLRIFTRWRSASALNTRSSSSASSSLSAALAERGAALDHGQRRRHATIISKKLDVLTSMRYRQLHASKFFDVLVAGGAAMTTRIHASRRRDRRRPGRARRRRAPARRGLEPLVFEAGDAVGASVREWGHVRVFSPWEYNVDPAAGRAARRGTAGARPTPTATRPATRSSSATSSRSPRCRRSRRRCTSSARVVGVTRARDRQAQGRRPRRRAVRARRRRGRRRSAATSRAR